MFWKKPVFIAPQSYKNASKKERAKVVNGCGPKGFDWFVPDNILGVNITECCAIHDWMYKQGVKLWEKNWADTVFYLNMKIATNFYNPTWKTLRNCQLKLAFFYYNMVLKYGFEAFANAQ